jgi:hypothetical protein
LVDLKKSSLKPLGQMNRIFQGCFSYHVSIHLAKWFQRRRFLEINQSETRIVCGGHVCDFFLAHLAKANVSFCHHLASIICRPLTFHIFSSPCQRQCELLPSFPTMFRFIWPSGFRGEDF